LWAKLRKNPEILGALVNLRSIQNQAQLKQAKESVADHLGFRLDELESMMTNFQEMPGVPFPGVPESQSLLTQSPNLQAKNRLKQLLQKFPPNNMDVCDFEDIQNWKDQFDKRGPEERLDVHDFFPEVSSSKSGKTEASNVVQYKQEVFRKLYPEFDALEKDIKEIMAYTKLINTIQASETKQEELSSEIISELQKLQEELKDLRSQYAKKKEDFCKEYNMKRSDLSYVLRKTIKDKPVLIDSGYVVKFPFAYAFLDSKKKQPLTY
jgi:hypothetical protein